MKIIIGLGNPGKEYEKTRHNAGYNVIDKVHKLLKFDDFKEKSKFEALVSEGEYNNEKVILVKPLTYMNLSGKTAASITKFYKLLFHDMWIVYDDLDIELGKFKIKEHGSAGSHNGMESIISSIGSENFPRIRLGIDSRTEKQRTNGKGKNYVLAKFNKKEEAIIFDIIDKAAESIIYALKNGIADAMNKYNTK
jgi:PTH1 family peptidyl-tRNA hydrolase